jgi:hypothetical protein
MARVAKCGYCPVGEIESLRGDPYIVMGQSVMPLANRIRTNSVRERIPSFR